MKHKIELFVIVGGFVIWGIAVTATIIYGSDGITRLQSTYGPADFARDWGTLIVGFAIGLPGIIFAGWNVLTLQAQIRNVRDTEDRREARVMAVTCHRAVELLLEFEIFWINFIDRIDQAIDEIDFLVTEDLSERMQLAQKVVEAAGSPADMPDFQSGLFKQRLRVELKSNLRRIQLTRDAFGDPQRLRYWLVQRTDDFFREAYQCEVALRRVAYLLEGATAVMEKHERMPTDEDLAERMNATDEEMLTKMGLIHHTNRILERHGITP